MDLYFERHDGQAVTCDDFVQAMQDASGVDLAQFRRWYAQAGTPVVTRARQLRRRARRTYTLDARAAHAAHARASRPSCRSTFRSRSACVGPDGRDLPLRLDGEAAPGGDDARAATCASARSRSASSTSTRAPVPSLLRGFSAPVTLEFDYADDELAFLAAHDSDPVNRWDAAQRSFADAMLRARRATTATAARSRCPRALVDVVARAARRPRAATRR